MGTSFQLSKLLIFVNVLLPFDPFNLSFAKRSVFVLFVSLHCFEVTRNFAFNDKLLEMEFVKMSLVNKAQKIASAKAMCYSEMCSETLNGHF